MTHRNLFRFFAHTTAAAAQKLVGETSGMRIMREAHNGDISYLRRTRNNEKREAIGNDEIDIIEKWLNQPNKKTIKYKKISVSSLLFNF